MNLNLNVNLQSVFKACNTNFIHSNIGVDILHTDFEWYADKYDGFTSSI